VAQVKDLRSGEQQAVKLPDIAASIAAYLK
jgi:hypothetical protein